MISISKKYQIDRAEKLQLVLERLKKDLEESQQKENVTEQKLVATRDLVYNQKKDIEDILERLEEEIVKENNQVILTSGTWKSIQKKLKTLIESE